LVRGRNPRDLTKAEKCKKDEKRERIDRGRIPPPTFYKGALTQGTRMKKDGGRVSSAGAVHN